MNDRDYNEKSHSIHWRQDTRDIFIGATVFGDSSERSSNWFNVELPDGGIETRSERDDDVHRDREYGYVDIVA